MKPKIAVVRGHYFSQDELDFYAPLKEDFDITFLSSVAGSSRKEASLPVEQVYCVDGIMNSLSFGEFRRIWGVVNNLTGINWEIVLGLERKLRGFDIVHSMDYNYALTFQLARLKKKLGYKLVAIHWENIPFARDNLQIAKRLKYEVYEKLDGFLAMSERAKASLLLEGIAPSKVFVTWYAVNTEQFRPRGKENLGWRRQYGISPDDVVILFVGRVRASKGVFELIYALKRLTEDPAIDSDKLKLVISGKGPGEDELDKRIKMLGLERNTIRTGFIPHGQIQFLHNIADIFTLPSIPRKYWQEQLGLVFLEAMACAKPIVTTLSGSIPEVVGDAGILVQPNDHVALCEGLKRLIMDPDLRVTLGKKGRRRVEDIFSFQKVSSNMLEAYRKILEKGDVTAAKERRS